MGEINRFGERLPAMLSYAQQGEDVVLRRAFSDLIDGFYVDVGAAWPVFDSVTKYFYEKGWSGINIEPEPDAFKQLQKDRPRDINLPVAVGATAGRATLRVYPDAPGWATTDSATRRRHEDTGLQATEVLVEARTLDSILDEHAPGKTIHFLKIDVEGSEEAVLRSVDLRRWSPRIVVVEATVPGTPRPKYEWEDILTEAGYALALFDGLNRFYAADAKLRDIISVPANVFDQYIPYRWWRLLTREAQIQFKRTALKGRGATTCR